jgi:hypothetical protein
VGTENHGSFQLEFAAGLSEPLLKLDSRAAEGDTARVTSERSSAFLFGNRKGGKDDGKANIAGDPALSDHTLGQQSTVSGGYSNEASGTSSSVIGGYNHSVSGNYDWKAGSCYFCNL